MNGLRLIGDLLAPRPILVGNPRRLDARAARSRTVDTMLGAVLAGPAPEVPDDERARRAPSQSSRRSCRASSPSVIPLAHAGMIAIHAVVGAEDVWALLPRLKAAGAVGILVLPIEKLIP